MIRDYDICAAQLNLSHKEKAIYFVNELEAPAQDLAFVNCSAAMSPSEIIYHETRVRLPYKTAYGPGGI